MRTLEPTLQGSRVTLRLPREADAVELARFYRENNAFFSRTQTAKPDAWLSPEFWMRRVPALRDEHAADRSVQLFMFKKGGTEVLGSIGLSGIMRGYFHAAYLGYLLAERVGGQGFMHEGLSLVIDYAFGPLGLHRLMANYVPTNRRSENVLKRLGFRVEGYAEQYLLINGVWTDHFLTSLTNPAWRPQ